MAGNDSEDGVMICQLCSNGFDLLYEDHPRL